MRKTLTLIRILILSILLTTLAPAWGQTQHGYDNDQSVKTSQRDNEDHETTLGWIGLFGLLGAVGVVGPNRLTNRGSRSGGPVGRMNVLTAVGLVLALSTTLWVLTPAFAQTKPDDTGYHAADATNSDNDRQSIPGIGMVGLLGLIGLLGLRRGRQTTDGSTHSGK